MEKYPVIIGGRTVGELSVERAGALTRFEADCEPLEGVVRLAVYGGGRRGYLGVLAPRGGRLHLKRSLTPTQLRSFPERIERAGAADGGAEEEESARDAVPEPGPAAADAAKPRACRASPDGALFFSGGARSLIALPAGDRRLLGIRCLGRRTIDGREYALISPDTYRVLR